MTEQRVSCLRRSSLHGYFRRRTRKITVGAKSFRRYGRRHERGRDFGAAAHTIVGIVIFRDLAAVEASSEVPQLSTRALARFFGEERCGQR